LLLTTTTADGSRAKAHDEGAGPPIVIVHPGLDDGSSYKRVASRLTDRFRVVRVMRPLYRRDLPGGCLIPVEAEHVVAVAKAIGQPSLLFGHSSGAVVALESLVAAPECFVGGIVYEPPLVTGPPIGGQAAARGRACLDAGKRARAMTIFARDVVGVPGSAARVSSVFIAAIPRFRRLIRRQFDDVDALDALGCRLDAYATIELPMVLIGGDRSPVHLLKRLDALGAVLPHSERVVLRGRAHDANFRAPGELAGIIASAADKLLR
jgi:pimeloyl-ACP methyl ester carboxylesterase